MRSGREPAPERAESSGREPQRGRTARKRKSKSGSSNNNPNSRLSNSHQLNSKRRSNLKLEPSSQDVHRFWFADTRDDSQAAGTRNAVWFGSSPEFDEEIRERFESTIDAASRGELSAWEDAPQSCVSLVIVLDQFPRNVYRNTAAAFKHDGLALAVTRRGVAAGHLEALSVPERAFLLMPYQHVEDVAEQQEGVRLFERTCNEAPPPWRAFVNNLLQFARRHLEIIERFGRFPHRNSVVGRSSTAAEREYLESKPETFGQNGG